MYNDLKLKFDNFFLVYANYKFAIPPFWNGKQHLFVYKKNADLGQITLDSIGFEKMLKEMELNLYSCQKELKRINKENKLLKEQLICYEKLIYEYKNALDVVSNEGKSKKLKDIINKFKKTV
jgi:hypothetical protein